MILYAAGRYDAAGGARLLDGIPDVVLRLFAEIEFAAGIAGLEQIGSITRTTVRAFVTGGRAAFADSCTSVIGDHYDVFRG